MNILLTNLQMFPFRGTENWCYAIGMELTRRGHKVSIYSPMPRQGISIFKAVGIDYVTSGKFDLILENHNVLTNTFSGKIIHTCHGTIPEERPFPNAINVAVSEKAAKQWKLDTIIKNGIDCNRMKPITKPNKEIKNVLSLCSSNEADDVLRKICSKLNLNLTTTYHKETMEVDRLINEADLVFGVGRSVYDAMACGRPVISFDCRFYIHPMHGCGYVYPDMVKNNNDNMTGKDNVWTEEQLTEEMKKYNPEDGINNSEYIRNNMNISDTVDKYLEIFERSK